MIIEIINQHGVRENIIATAVESWWDASSEPGLGLAPDQKALRVRLHSGAVLVAQHDTPASFQMRLAAARGGMPLHVQAIAPDKLPETLGPLAPWRVSAPQSASALLDMEFTGAPIEVAPADPATGRSAAVAMAPATPESPPDGTTVVIVESTASYSPDARVTVSPPAPPNGQIIVPDVNAPPLPPATESIPLPPLAPPPPPPAPPPKTSKTRHG